MLQMFINGYLEHFYSPVGWEYREFAAVFDTELMKHLTLRGIWGLLYYQGEEFFNQVCKYPSSHDLTLGPLIGGLR